MRELSPTSFPSLPSVKIVVRAHDPASVLRLSQLDKSASGMRMQVPTLPGKIYRLEYTDDLTTNQWHPLTAPIPGDGQPVLIVDPAGITRPQRFYRLRVEQP